MARSRGAVAWIVGLGAAGGLLGAVTVIAAANPARYPAKTRGRLLEQGQGGLGGRRPGTDVTYQFYVEGKAYRVQGRVDDAQDVADVWYDPADPADASFRPERSSGLVVAGAALAAACLLLAGGAAVRTAPR